MDFLPLDITNYAIPSFQELQDILDPEIQDKEIKKRFNGSPKQVDEVLDFIATSDSVDLFRKLIWSNEPPVGPGYSEWVDKCTSVFRKALSNRGFSIIDYLVDEGLSYEEFLYFNGNDGESDIPHQWQLFFVYQNLIIHNPEKYIEYFGKQQTNDVIFNATSTRYILNMKEIEDVLTLISFLHITENVGKLWVILQVTRDLIKNVSEQYMTPIDDECIQKLVNKMTLMQYKIDIMEGFDKESNLIIFAMKQDMEVRRLLKLTFDAL